MGCERVLQRGISWTARHNSSALDCATNPASVASLAAVLCCLHTPPVVSIVNNLCCFSIMHCTCACRCDADGTVLSRLLELLDILCTRLGRSNGLLHEEYTPAGGKGQWSPTGNILYGA